MLISEYLGRTCLKELAILLKCGKTFEKLVQHVTLLKMLLFHSVFLPHFQNKYFLDHLTMATSGNVTKYAVLHHHEQYNGILV